MTAHTTTPTTSLNFSKHRNEPQAMAFTQMMNNRILDIIEEAHRQRELEADIQRKMDMQREKHDRDLEFAMSKEPPAKRPLERTPMEAMGEARRRPAKSGRTTELPSEAILCQHLSSRMLFLQEVQGKEWQDEADFKKDLVDSYHQEEAAYRQQWEKEEMDNRSYLKFMQIEEEPFCQEMMQKKRGHEDFKETTLRLLEADEAKLNNMQSWEQQEAHLWKLMFNGIKGHADLARTWTTEWEAWDWQQLMQMAKKDKKTSPWMEFQLPEEAALPTQGSLQRGQMTLEKMREVTLSD